MKFFENLFGSSTKEHTSAENVSLDTLAGRLINAKQFCLGMEEVDYQFAQYFANCWLSDESASSIARTIPAALEGLAEDDANDDLFWWHRSHPEEVRFFLQIMDAVADPETADELRSCCKQLYGWEVVRYVIPVEEEEEEFPLAVQCALDWWSGALQRRLIVHDNPYPRDADRDYTEQEITAFRRVLGKLISHDLAKGSFCKIENGVRADSKLREACAEIKIGELLSSYLFRSGTTMYVLPHRVIIHDRMVEVASYDLDYMIEHYSDIEEPDKTILL